MNNGRLIAIVVWVVMSACAGPSKVADEQRLGSSGSSNPDLYSQEGMTRAVYEIEAALGTEKLQPIAAGYERACRLDPHNPFKRFLWAYAMEDRNEAWTELTKITKLDDGFYWAYLGMGIILDSWRVFDQAEKNYQLAHKLKPRVAIGAHRFGRMYLRQNEPAKALVLLKTAVEQDPHNDEYLLDFARVQRDAGQVSDALSSYQRLLERAPHLFVARAERADLLAKSGNTDDAVEEYRKAIALDDKTYEACVAFATLLVEQGRLDEAADAYQTACPLKPDRADCWRTLAGLAVKLDKPNLRRLAFEQVVKVENGDLEAHRFLATAYLQANEIEKALPSFEQLHAKLPDDTEALFGLAEIYQRGEEPSKALEFYERLLAREPGLNKARVARDQLFERFSILIDPISGNNPQQIFAKSQYQVDKVYKMRLKERPRLQGDLILKVTVNNLGKVEDVFVSKDTVADPVIETSALWNLKRARFPKGIGATYNFSLSLKPGQ